MGQCINIGVHPDSYKHYLLSISARQLSLYPEYQLHHLLSLLVSISELGFHSYLRDDVMQEAEGWLVQKRVRELRPLDEGIVALQQLLGERPELTHCSFPILERQLSTS